MENVNLNIRVGAAAPKKFNTDERLVRKVLVKTWTRILERYAQPGVKLPSVDQLRSELIEAGVKAAVDKLCSEHWFLGRWMVESDVKQGIIQALDRFDLAGLIEDVKTVQMHPELLPQLRNNIAYLINN